ncbi:pyrethroid hydrolase Ces2e-like isoform X3 [Planococcus citri]|uniref:pyrethroid hydrolase Ces2e-like isoform X3 n=1 Tax=Planococcus citri TaxID=170843 RepID=UPI0031F7E331
MVFDYEKYAQSREQADKLTEIYKNYYFGDTEIRDNVHAFSKMRTCLFYLPAVKEIVKLYQGPTYLYYYDHRNKETFGPMYAKYDDDMGVIHGDELISMYNWSEVITPVTEGIDLVVSKQVLKLWTNFAATGDPNNDGEQIWRPVDSPDINYLHIKGGVLETKEALLKTEYEFLESVLSKLSRDEL